MNASFLRGVVVWVVLFFATLFSAAAAPPLNLTMDGYDYPYPVSYLPLKIEGQEVRLAYMDVAPTKGSGDLPAPTPDDASTVILFHGKNFPGAYWKGTVEALRAKGFRVIVPDQIGFGKSSKPAIHYSFHELATNTRLLIEYLKISRVDVVGHSMGGMLAVRFALMFPETTSHLVLENPLGLEDYREQVIYLPTSELYEQALRQTEEQIQKFQAAYYTAWKPEYEEWVKVQARFLQGPYAASYALASALTSQMIYEQPVCYEFARVIAPTLLVIGQSDRTAPGKDRLTAEAAGELGNYPRLGKLAAKTFPRARLVELPNVGHIPHLEAPEVFYRELTEFLLSPTAVEGKDAGRPRR